MGVEEGVEEGVEDSVDTRRITQEIAPTDMPGAAQQCHQHCALAGWGLVGKSRDVAMAQRFERWEASSMVADPTSAYVR